MAAKSKTAPKAPLSPRVGIVMGSQSDWETMQHAADVLDVFEIPYETLIVSAHRTPKRLYDYAGSAVARDLKIVIAGAGGSAHLPGMIAALTPLPVLGVPVQSKTMDGLDSLLSIVQMPAGIPVGTLAVGKAGAINAALFAASILALSDKALAKQVRMWREAQTAAVGFDPSEPAPKPKKATRKKKAA